MQLDASSGNGAVQDKRLKFKISTAGGGWGGGGAESDKPLRYQPGGFLFDLGHTL